MKLIIILAVLFMSSCIPSTSTSGTTYTLRVTESAMGLSFCYEGMVNESTFSLSDSHVNAYYPVASKRIYYNHNTYEVLHVYPDYLTIRLVSDK